MNVTRSLGRMCSKAGLYLRKNSSTILSCVAVAGVVATAVSAARATPKAIKLLEQTKMEQGRQLTTAEKVIVAAPVYAPTLLLGASTAMCIFGANALNKQQQASLASAYALVNRSYKDYRNKLIELHGEEMDEEIRDAVIRTRCDYHQINIDIPDERAVFYEVISGEYVTRYEREIMDAEYHLNRNFVLNGYASLNEFLKFLGLPQTDYGEEVGWTCTDGYYWVDFEHRLISQPGEPPVYVIDYMFGPDNEYLREWQE